MSDHSRPPEPDLSGLDFSGLDLVDSVPYLVVRDGDVVAIGHDVERELGCDPTPLLGPLEAIGRRLDDVSLGDLCHGRASVRVRLGAALDDRPVRLRRLGEHGDATILELRSLAEELRLEKLLRRSDHGHMLLSPDVELAWSMTSNELADIFPGDDPSSWVDLVDPDDMEALGRAIVEVGKDPNLTRIVRHRLRADRTYTIVDTVESAVHDPDLRGVLVRSRLEGVGAMEGDPDRPAPYAGMMVSDHMPIGVIVASDQGRVLHRNAAAGMFVGARVGQLVVPLDDEPWVFDGVDAEQAARFLAVFAAATAGSTAHCTVSAPGDHRRWLRLSVSPAAASTVVITIEDTTELAEAERAARASSRLLEALDAHSEELVLVFDVVGRSRYVSSAVHRHLGDVVIDQAADVLQLVHPHDRPALDTLVRHIRSSPSESDTAEFRLVVEPDGSCRWYHATVTNLIDDPDIQGFVITMRDVHEHHLAERELRFRATHDALTTLPDRAALQSRIEAILRTGERDGWRTALVFCDVDRFKLVNDRAGHRIGDTVLTEVASRLRTALRSSDFVGRFGGDEFVVVAPHVDDEDHAMSLAERIFDEVVGPVRSGEVEVDISVSMGVAVNDSECTTAAGLLHRADLAMYEAKRLGRGRVTRYSHHLGLGSEEVGTMRADLRAAIDDHQFLMHYQPIVALTDGLASGYESLARWQHPELGVVTARRFIAIAESAGVIAELGDELVRLACRDVGTAIVTDDHFVSINLSSAQLSHPGAATSVLGQLRSNLVDPRSIVVELTEAAFAQGPTVRANLETFRDHGVRIFLDDFGVGYSSLSQLRHFPVDGIKIDASIINPSVDVDLVRLIVGVARTLGIRTIAEGVETAEQLDTVHRLGVDYAQGFHLGRPSRSSSPTAAGQD